MKSPLIIVAMLCSPALAAPPGGLPPPSSVYRFDVSITGLDTTPATYALVLAEAQQGRIESGANIPYPGASGVSRELLGMELKMTYVQRGSVLLLEGDFDVKSLGASGANGPTWNDLRADGLVMPITVGKPMLLTSVYDVAAHRRYEVTITAQRVL